MSTLGPAVVDALTKREMSVAELADRADVPIDELADAIERNSSLTDDQLFRVADELAVPIRALFSEVPLPLSVVPDFRRRTPRPGLYHKGTLNALGFVEKLSSTLSSLPHNVAPNSTVERFDGQLTKRNAINLAESWRKRWGITDRQQLDWRSSHAVYNSLRDFIEGMGVFVVHRTFGTDEVAGVYTKVGDGPDVVVINTTGSNKARKLFTLAHEFCHVLIGKTGASNPSVLKNSVERFCNKFAAHLLAPDHLIGRAIKEFKYPGGLDRDDVRRFAAKIGLSQHATALRLVEFGAASDANYSRWRSLFAGVVPPGDQSDGGGGTSDPIRNKRTQYGTSLIRALAVAVREDYLDEIDVYRLSGIKPKYQKPLFEG
ncbi:ImmA/IrrE family metallo-endopeptidase [Tropicimonas marinistellae]|uniref:ImmA/IrrE family metallo-endopeptidase n=1 Tax=Tropicimonas marinistellae TaxID=1739787 RepID=UPI0008369193|nr:ImmA/IrrE family metallo-endopeptidase [Tropicimonas marinistellae]